MTVHAAKGLEFEHVVVAGLEEGVFPSMRSSDSEIGVEEERRLMYVAITRGMKSVLLTSAKERMVNGETMRMETSRFLKEIPKDCKQSWDAAWHSYEQETTDSEAWGVDPDPDAIVQVQRGMRVRHGLFGLGVVRSTSGQGATMRAVVRFDDGVERTLILEYAGLEPAEETDSW